MVAVTLLGTATFTSAAGTKTVTATPAVDDLIIIIAATTLDGGPVSVSDNQGGTYTWCIGTFKTASDDGMSLYVRDSLVSSAVSTIYTLTTSGLDNGGGLAVMKATGVGAAGTGVIRQVANIDNQAVSTPTPVFASAALTGNALIGAVFNGANPATVTPRSSPAWTERLDTGYNAPVTGLEIMSIDSGETATSIAWGASVTSSYGALVAEITAPAAGGSFPPLDKLRTMRPHLVR